MDALFPPYIFLLIALAAKPAPELTVVTLTPDRIRTTLGDFPLDSV